MGGEVKKWKSRPLYQTQPDGNVKWMATSERVNLFSNFDKKRISPKAAGFLINASKLFSVKDLYLFIIVHIQ